MNSEPFRIAWFGKRLWSTLVCLEDRKWCGLIGSLQKTNQVAVGSIRVFSKLGCVFIKVEIWKIGVLPCFFVKYKNILLKCLWCISVPQNGEGLCCIFSFQFKARLALTIQLCTVQSVDMIIFNWHSMALYGVSNCNGWQTAHVWQCETLSSPLMFCHLLVWAMSCFYKKVWNNRFWHFVKPFIKI